MPLVEGEVLWEPAESFRDSTRLWAFMQWLRSERGLAFDDYQSLWQWSVDDLAAFWSAVWEFFDIQADGDPSVVLASDRMPGARWFPDVRLNYAEHAFRPFCRGWKAIPRSPPTGSSWRPPPARSRHSCYARAYGPAIASSPACPTRRRR